MKNTTHIASRWELFLDEQMIAARDGLELRLQQPIPREIAVEMDKPWEDVGSGVYNTVLKDGDEYRLYYRASWFSKDAENVGDRSENQFTCMAVSPDGIHWTKPELGIIEIEGSTANNAIFAGVNAHNFTPFIDKKPGCPASERYKGTAGHNFNGLSAYVSADGIHWTVTDYSPILTDGAFDSQNLAFYDTVAGKYRCYSRYFHKFEPQRHVYDGVRAIQHADSEDFVHWGEQIPNTYSPVYPWEHFYTNATTPCPGAEHYLISIPMRFNEDRKKVPSHEHGGISDGVLLSSRDGTNFSRLYPEAFIRPAIGDDNWTQRCYITAAGILETSPTEFSIYVGEHYMHSNACIRRYTLRRHGFAALHGNYTGGTMTTEPFTFTGSELMLNYATSAIGSVKVEILRQSGEVWESEELYGNSVEERIGFGEGRCPGMLEGETVRLRFTLRDADLFGYRFA